MGFLKIAFLDVGQGDTTIVYDPETLEAIVVDCNDFLKVLNFLKANHINRIRALIITHTHADHYSGLVGLLENCVRQHIEWDACIFNWDRPLPTSKTEWFRDTDGHSDQGKTGPKKNSSYQQLLIWARQPGNKKKHLEPRALPRDSKITNSITFCHPEFQDIQELYETGSLNNLSIIVRVQDGSSALITGDIEPPGWKFLRENYPELVRSEILKFPHHGVWRNSDISLLLSEIDPEYVVISVGSGNKYNHPSPEVLSEIRKRQKIRLLCTQATNICSGNLQRTRLNMQKWSLGNASFGTNHFQNGNGCPCAGTVVFELSDKVKLIWPNNGFHTEVISRFMNTPQCVQQTVTGS